jgi:hypothetical protein
MARDAAGRLPVVRRVAHDLLGRAERDELDDAPVHEGTRTR